MFKGIFLCSKGDFYVQREIPTNFLHFTSNRLFRGNIFGKVPFFLAKCQKFGVLPKFRHSAKDISMKKPV